MIDPFGTKLNAAVNRCLFEAQPRETQDAILQNLYDLGFSGRAIGKALGVPAVDTRIDAHRGRGPALHPA